MNPSQIIPYMKHHSDYMNKNIISMPFELQLYARSCIGRTPILCKIENAMSNHTNGISKDQKVSLLAEVRKCLSTLAIFRLSHQGITKKSMEKRDEDPHGSAGYGPQDLQYIIELQDPQLKMIIDLLHKLNL